MIYINIREPGDPDVLELAQGDTPKPGPGQVLIKVEAIGVNRPDVIQRMGFYPPPPGASPIPGLEVAGEVVATGDNVKSPKSGDKVCALMTGGGYAEYAIAESAICLPIPKGLSMIEAAALPETFFTVWSNLFDRAKLKSNENFLVHGGSSGIGTVAIQLAKAFGSTVYTTAGNDEKCETCLNLGADVAVNYKTQDFVAECKTASNDHGMDVILDMVAGDYVMKNIEVAAPDGRIVIIAVLGGVKAEVDFSKIMRKRLVITGSTLRNRSVEFKADIAGKLKEHVWPLLESGKVKPVIYKSLPLTEAAEAHRLMESSRHIGKIMLVP